MTSYIRHLTNILLKNVDALEELERHHQVQFPTLDDEWDPQSPQHSFTLKPEVREVTMIAVSAAAQLVATLKSPIDLLYERTGTFSLTAALRVLSEACVADILRDAGPSGAHLSDIAKRTGLDASMLGRCLRLSATQHIFKEIKPDIFVNNRPSSLLDTGKDVEGLLEQFRSTKRDPDAALATDIAGLKCVNDKGFSAGMEYRSDEIFKSSAVFADIVLANDYSKTPFERASKCNGSIYQFFECYPGRARRFRHALALFNDKKRVPFIGLDWSSLEEGTVVVDVGAGNGTQVFDILQKNPKLKVILQDTEKTIKDVVTPLWSTDPARKSLVGSNSVTLEAHDFFQPQPQRAVGFFHMRNIIHNWSTTHCHSILRNLRTAAQPETRLVISDVILPYICPSSEPDPQIKFHYEGGLGQLNEQAQYPLLSNLGDSSIGLYLMDFVMGITLGGLERTLGQYKELCAQTGWEITEVYQSRWDRQSHIVCRLVS